MQLSLTLTPPKDPLTPALPPRQPAITVAVAVECPHPAPSDSERAESSSRPPPGTRCTLRPLLDSQGRTRPTWADKVLTILGYCPQGFALLDVGTSHPYPASVGRLICQ